MGDFIFIIDFDKAQPPSEYYVVSKKGEIDGVEHKSRFMPLDFDAREWVASIEPKHYRKLPYIIRHWYEKDNTLLRNDDVWYLADAHKDTNSNPFPGVFLDWYRTRKRGATIYYVVATLNRPPHGYKKCEVVASLIDDDDKNLAAHRSDDLKTQVAMWLYALAMRIYRGERDLKYRMPRWTRSYLSL